MSIGHSEQFVMSSKISVCHFLSPSGPIPDFDIVAVYENRKVCLYERNARSCLFRKIAFCFDVSDCSCSLHMWELSYAALELTRVSVLYIGTSTEIQLFYITFNNTGDYHSHVRQKVRLSSEIIPQILPVFEKKRRSLFLYSDDESFCSSELLAPKNNDTELTLTKYIMTSDLGMQSKISGRKEESIHSALCVNSTNFFLIYEDKRNSLFIAQWCLAVESSKQLRIQWLLSISSDELSAVSSDEVSAVEGIVCIAGQSFIWIVSQQGVLSKFSTSIPSPLTALMCLSKSLLSSSKSLLHLVACGKNGEYFHIRIHGSVTESFGESSADSMPKYVFDGMRVSKMRAGPALLANSFHFYEPFLPFCLSMHFVAVKASVIYFLGYHPNFGVQYLALVKHPKVAPRIQENCSLSVGPLDNLSISHALLFQRNERPLTRFLCASVDTKSCKSTVHKICRGYSLFPRYAYELEYQADLEFFVFPLQFLQRCLILLSSKVSRSSSLMVMTFNNDSDSHSFVPVEQPLIRNDEATLGFISIHEKVVLQVTEKHLVAIKVSASSTAGQMEDLAVSRSESVSSLFAGLDKSKKTLELASNFVVQFYGYFKSVLFLACRNTLLTVAVSFESNLAATFRLSNVNNTKHSMSGLAVTELFGGAVRCICVSYWEVNSIELHLVDANGTIQRSSVIETMATSIFRHLVLISESKESDYYSIDIIAGSDDGSLKVFHVKVNSRSSKLECTAIFDIAKLPAITSLIACESFSKSDFLFINGSGTDYALKCSYDNSKKKRTYQIIPITQSAAGFRRSLRTYVYKDENELNTFENSDKSGGNIACLWLERGNICISSIPFGSCDVSSCVEKSLSIDGIIDRISLKEDDSVLQIWCIPQASNNFIGSIIMMNAVDLTILWRRNIGSTLTSTSTDELLLKDIQFGLLRKQSIADLSQWFYSISTSVSISPSFTSTFKTLSIAAHCVSNFNEQSGNDMRIFVDQCDIPLKSPPSIEGRDKYLGKGEVLSTQLSNDVIVLLLPDRRIVAVGWSDYNYEERVASRTSGSKLVVLAECELAWKATSISTMHCLLEKFCIIGIFGHGIEIFEFRSKIYGDSAVKLELNIPLPGSSIVKIAARVLSLSEDQNANPIYFVQIACWDSISLKVSVLYVRLPHKDCKLEPPVFSPINQDIEFEDKEVEQVVCNIFPIHNDAWDFALITESCNIVRFRAKSTKV